MISILRISCWVNSNKPLKYWQRLIFFFYFDFHAFDISKKE